MKLSGPIVIIDDDKDDQEILVEILQHVGPTRDDVRVFDSCPAALKYLETTLERPFIILCDINLPAMNGLEFRREINQNEFLRKKSIPFVFLSTAAVKQQVEEAYDLSVQGFFVKQFSFKVMQETLSNILKYWTGSVHPNSVR